MTTSRMSCRDLEPAGVGGDPQHALPGRVVDEQLGLSQHVAGLDAACSMSSALRWPLRSLWLSTRAWQQSRRSASSMRDCSRLTKKTGSFLFDDDVADDVQSATPFCRRSAGPRG